MAALFFLLVGARAGLDSGEPAVSAHIHDLFIYQPLLCTLTSLHLQEAVREAKKDIIAVVEKQQVTTCAFTSVWCSVLWLI
jgi:hypothetical protein